MIRTRFAPSPTGFLHVGGIRTALFAFLLARQQGGQFILRFEDTDKKREVPGSAAHLIASLRTIGISYDEGPDIGGPYGPYIQSERLEHYRHYAEELIAAGRAYADPYTPEDVQSFREEAASRKQPFLYRHHRPEHPPVWDGTMPLRFKSDPKPYEWHDEVMGTMHTGAEVIDDFILIKSDGYPTYNFAHIIDDYEMEITHVIRGQEFLSSVPNYLNLYEALGIERPVLAHMPHVMNAAGNKKLGKRDGAKDVLDYIRDGYLPEAMMSFIATLGWNDGTTQELFTLDELIERFSLAKVQRSGARFDEKRLLWVNGEFIRRLDLNDLMGRVNDFWPAAATSAQEALRVQVLALAQSRLKTLADLRTFGYFFEDPSRNDSLITGNKMLAKLSSEQIATLINAAHDKLALLEDWSSESIQTVLNELLESTGEKPGIVFGLIRIFTTWAPFSPELPATLAVLGKAAVLRRLSA